MISSVITIQQLRHFHVIFSIQNISFGPKTLGQLDVAVLFDAHYFVNQIH